MSTRLWLGGTLSGQRNMALVEALIQKVRACALCRPLLFCTDGFQAYVQAIRSTLREPIHTGRRGRPSMRGWDGIFIARVVKQYVAHRVCGIECRLIQGVLSQVNQLIQRTQGGGEITPAAAGSLSW